MNALVKSTIREMKNSLGRYLAILIIIALGVGFFAGLRTCRPSLISTADQYFETQNFYDFRLLSSVGFSKDSVGVFIGQENISAAEGACYEDVLITVDGNDLVFRVYSATDSINKLQLVSGRLPESDKECVIDADYADESMIGQTIPFSGSNDQSVQDAFDTTEFLVAGTVKTPLYINLDRGTASVGDGKIAAFLFVNENCFTADYYKELYVSLKDRAEIYSGTYKDSIADMKPIITDLAEEQAESRCQEIVSEMQGEIDASFFNAESELSGQPSVYVLTRSENAGYAAFEQDSTIIENISVVFPAFFFLVAALVCATTMTRMVSEQRTQIGTLKAMGYSRWKISQKYLCYAGSAGLIGSVAGFFAGTKLVPMAFWYAYRSIYNFADQLLYAFSPVMYALSMVIAIFCTAGVTWLCCRKELQDVPASILRPKAPKNGRRVFLERFQKLWQHISFLHKVSLRNVLRYKQRFFLMILGISGCTALLLTGFGIRDSIQNVTDYQYGEITLYDAEITFTDVVSKTEQEDFTKHCGSNVDSLLFVSECKADIRFEDTIKSTKLTSVPEGDLSPFIHLQTGGEVLPYPGDGEIVISKGIADKLGADSGDFVTLADDSFHTVTVKVTGLFDNYVGDYLFVSQNTMIQLNGEAQANAAYALFKPNSDPNTEAAEILKENHVGSVSLNSTMKESIETSFSSLNIVVVLIILCAGVLAFVVLFNLININIRERIREIATLRVLGFFHKESAAYVFREVNMLTVIGTVLGLLLGKLLHAFVMSQIHTDGICFDSRIVWSSYLFSIVSTLAFAGLVKLVMRRKLKKIDMAESLKSVE